MAKKWIAIVNRVEARIFDARDMRKLYTLRNTLGREKNRAFTTSKPGIGRNRTASRESTHNLTGEKNPHDDAAIQFAKRINTYLHKRWSDRRFGKILVVAEPRMKGWLRAGMDKSVLRHCEWKSKDLVKLSDYEIKVRFLGKSAARPKIMGQFVSVPHLPGP